MNDNITISTFQLFQMFPDEETARVYLEARLWPDGVKCPVCSAASERITPRKNGYYRCNDCREDFTVRTGTIFERSHIPLHKWIYAMYLLMTARKGISSLQLSKEIGITQKSAWFMLHRLREACGGKDLKKLRGIIEVDETYIGGKEGNKHESKKLHMGRGGVGKAIVFGMRERGGRVIARHVSDADAANLHPEIYKHVEIGSVVNSDEAPVYADLWTKLQTLYSPINQQPRPRRQRKDSGNGGSMEKNDNQVEEKVHQTCNRHYDCAAAEAIFVKDYGRKPRANFHCHDDCCEDCLGAETVKVVKYIIPLVIMGQRWEPHSLASFNWDSAGTIPWVLYYVIGEVVNTDEHPMICVVCRRIEERFTFPVPNQTSRRMTPKEAEAINKELMR